MIELHISQPRWAEVLLPPEVDTLVPSAGQVLLRVAAAGVNRPGLMQRLGVYPMPPGVTQKDSTEYGWVVTL